MIGKPGPAILGVCAMGRPPTVDGVIGTAFGVSTEVVVTAFHCVGNRSTGEIGSGDVHVFLGNDEFVTATVLDPHHDLDIAILGLHKPLPDHLLPLPLVTSADPMLPFQSPGWPTSRPFPGFSTTLSGHVVALVSVFEGSPALQLYCHQAATMNLHGYSGAPVVISRGGMWAVAGVVRWNQPRDDLSGLAAGGTVYATPIATLLERSPVLTDAGKLIDASSEAGYCVVHSKADEPVASWIGSVLRMAGFDARVRGEYIRPGDNFPAKLADAHRTYPNSIVLCSPTTLTCDSPSHLEELRILRNREYGGTILPIRTASLTLPDLCAAVEPLDLFNSLTDDHATAMIVNALHRPETFANPAPAALSQIIDENPELLIRSRLSKASFDTQPSLGGIV